MLSMYNEKNLIGVLYFVDPDLRKNIKFYNTELSMISHDYNIQTYLFYGKELFDHLNCSDVWNEILRYLEKWKKEIPDMPEINFDKDSDKTFHEIKNLKPLVFRKLLENDEVFHEIILTLFPKKKTLKLLYKYFSHKSETIYKTIAQRIYEKL